MEVSSIISNQIKSKIRSIRFVGPSMFLFAIPACRSYVVHRISCIEYRRWNLTRCAFYSSSFRFCTIVTFHRHTEQRWWQFWLTTLTIILTAIANSNDSCLSLWSAFLKGAMRKNSNSSETLAVDTTASLRDCCFFLRFVGRRMSVGKWWQYYPRRRIDPRWMTE